MNVVQMHQEQYQAFYDTFFIVISLKREKEFLLIELTFAFSARSNGFGKVSIQNISVSKFSRRAFAIGGQVKRGKGGNAEQGGGAGRNNQ